jgi:DNA-directed RNA polymerase subunit RPC12/RpoP
MSNAVDYVRFQCLVCSRPLTATSQAGTARFLDFRSSSVPIVIATDIDGRKVTCHCGVQFVIASHLPHRVACSLVPAVDIERTTPCLHCGSRMIPRKEEVAFDVDVVLADITVYRCSRCGEEETAIPRINGLLSCLQREKQRPVRLTPGVDW